MDAPLLLVAALLAALIVLRVASRRPARPPARLPARRPVRRPSPAPRPQPALPAERMAASPATTPKSHVIVRQLAAQGLSTADIARRARIAQDAVALIVQRTAATPSARSSA